ATRRARHQFVDLPPRFRIGCGSQCRDDGHVALARDPSWIRVRCERAGLVWLPKRRSESCADYRFESNGFDVWVSGVRVKAVGLACDWKLGQPDRLERNRDRNPTHCDTLRESKRLLFGTGWRIGADGLRQVRRNRRKLDRCRSVFDEGFAEKDPQRVLHRALTVPLRDLRARRELPAAVVQRRVRSRHDLVVLLEQTEQFGCLERKAIVPSAVELIL